MSIAILEEQHDFKLALHTIRSNANPVYGAADRMERNSVLVDNKICEEAATCILARNGTSQREVTSEAGKTPIHIRQ